MPTECLSMWDADGGEAARCYAEKPYGHYKEEVDTLFGEILDALGDGIRVLDIGAGFRAGRIWWKMDFAVLVGIKGRPPPRQGRLMRISPTQARGLRSSLRSAGGRRSCRSAARIGRRLPFEPRSGGMARPPAERRDERGVY